MRNRTTIIHSSLVGLPLPASLGPTDFGKGLYICRAYGPYSEDIADDQHLRQSIRMNGWTDPAVMKILQATLEMDLTLMERSDVPPRLIWKYDSFNDAVKSIKAMLAKIKSSNN